MTREDQSKIIIISAPSGTGKSTIIRKLMKKHPNQFRFSISTTTRPPRGSEINGVHYFFVDKKTFEEKEAQNQFLEVAKVHNECYGTSKEMVKNIIKGNHYCILEIDVQGALKVQKIYPYVKTIFILPPSLTELKKRLLKRGDTDLSEIELRMQNALEELSFINHYKHFIVNHSIKTTLLYLEKAIYEPNQ